MSQRPVLHVLFSTLLLLLLLPLTASTTSPAAGSKHAHIDTKGGDVDPDPETLGERLGSSNGTFERPSSHGQVVYHNIPYEIRWSTTTTANWAATGSSNGSNPGPQIQFCVTKQEEADLSPIRMLLIQNVGGETTVRNNGSFWWLPSA